MSRSVVLLCICPGLALGPLGSGLQARPLPPPPPRPHPAPLIAPNDNRVPAGRLRNGVLTVHLDTRAGVWYPEGPGGMGLPVAAFAEEGKRLQAPGPLIRVVAGTEVVVTVRNSLARPLVLFGLGPARGIGPDSTIVAPGTAGELHFRASAPGTFFYIGRTSTGQPWFTRSDEDSQLTGAIVVDPAGAPPPRDRIFMLSQWFVLDPKTESGVGRASLVINGLSWPHTERIEATQGDSLRWRVINPTLFTHPMHLHGFYFTVLARGDGRADTTYAPEQRRMAVTEPIGVGETMLLAWSPTRPGNWIFHCHLTTHISPVVALAGAGQEQPAHDPHGYAMGDHTMAGLVLGIHVKPRGTVVAAPGEARSIRLLVRSRPNVYGARPGYAFVLGGSPAEADSSALPTPGPTLVLRRGQPVAITIVNRAHEPAAIHWHGIELDSYPDGVPGWSGQGRSILPSIPPGDSLTVRFTPPRAGTFMYHSHFNEVGQITSGLYGAIVVVDDPARYDPDTDRILLFSDGGPSLNVVAGPWPPVLLNGQATPPPLEFRAGVTYRLRLICIRGDLPVELSILDGKDPARWTALAVDGADLPPAQATVSPAQLTFGPGEIRDYTFTPEAGHQYALRFGLQDPGQQPPSTTVPIHLR